MTGLFSIDPAQPKQQPHDSWILWLPVFLIMGLAGYYSLDREPSANWLVSALIGIILILTITWKYREYFLWRWVGVGLALVCFGAAYAQWQTSRNITQLLTQRYWSVLVDGEIIHAERAGQGWRVVLSDIKLDDQSDKRYVIRLTLRQKTNDSFEVGGRLRVQASLMPPRAPLLSGMFDFQRHAFFDGISGYGYTTKIIDYGPPQKNQNHFIDDYRLWISDHVYQNLDQPQAGIVVALLNGQRGGITKAITNLLQASGLQHIISISGLHVGLMAGVVFYVVRLILACSMTIALRYPIKKIAALMSMIAIVAYMMIVGLSPATVRSVIMTSIILLAIIVEREAINLRLVAIAAIVILLLQPHSVLDIGFQLSFSAVVGLVVFFQKTQEFWQKAFWNQVFFNKILRVFTITIATTLVATMATAPLTLAYFQKLPLLSMLSNLLATPLVTFLIMPGSVLTYIFSFNPWLMQWPIELMGIGTSGLIMISSFVTNLPLAVLTVRAPQIHSVIIFILGLYILCTITNRWRYSAVVPIMMAFFLWITHQTPDVILTEDRVLGIIDDKNKLLKIEGKIDSFQKNLLLSYLGLSNMAPLDCSTEICDFKSFRLAKTVSSLDKVCIDKPKVVITRYYLKNSCIGTAVFDRHTLDNQGGLALYFNQDNRVISSVRSIHSNRLWQQTSPKQDWHFKNDRFKMDSKEGKYETRHK